MKKDRLESILEDMLSTGGDFAEIFMENKKTTVFNYIDSNLDGYSVNYSNGLDLDLLKIIMFIMLPLTILVRKVLIL